MVTLDFSTDAYQVVKKTIKKALEYQIWKYGIRTERTFMAMVAHIVQEDIQELYTWTINLER